MKKANRHQGRSHSFDTARHAVYGALSKGCGWKKDKTDAFGVSFLRVLERRCFLGHAKVVYKNASRGYSSHLYLLFVADLLRYFVGRYVFYSAKKDGSGEKQEHRRTVRLDRIDGDLLLWRYILPDNGCG